MNTHRLVVALVALASGPATPLPAADGPCRQLREISIGGEGVWDYLIALAPDLGRGCVSNGRESTASIADLKTLQIAPGEEAPGLTLDPANHRLYVAAAEFAPPTTGQDGQPQRAQVEPGSLRVVVCEMADR